MNNCFLIIYFAINLSAAFGQDPMQKPDAVLMNEQVKYVLKGNYNATKTVYRKYKVNNQRGLRAAQLVVFYDEFSKVKNIDIKVLHILGNEITTDKNKTIYDQSLSSGSVYSDSRVKYSKIIENRFPFIVMYNYTISYDEFYSFPEWKPQQSPFIKVENAFYTIEYPADRKLKFKIFNMDIDPKYSIKPNHNSIEFMVKNIPNYEPEPFSPPFWERMPVVYVAQNDFKFHGYKGSLKSWQTYGHWFYELNSNRDVLPEELASKIRILIEDCSDTTEMVRRIYQYVQDNTRYVSISLGIGGLQPDPAKAVAENGWGDCKALSNFTISLLKSTGIKANYTLVNSGRDARPMMTDFPDHQFDHVIVNVPIEHDTIWLECTSQQAPFNFLGSFTAGRYALSIDNENSTLIRTPEYDYRINVSENIATFKLDEFGAATTNFVLNASGIEFEKYQFLLSEDKIEQERWIIENIDIKTFDLESFEVIKDISGLAKMELKLKLFINHYASVSGKRMFIPLKIYDPLEDIPNVDKDRKNDIFLRDSYVKTDSVVFQIPLGYSFEYIPDHVYEESKFGTFEMDVSQDENFITYHRKLKVNQGRFPASDYAEFVAFYRMVQKADRQQVVLVKQ